MSGRSLDDPARTPFTHAVASFDPSAEGVLLWTRAVGAPGLRWAIEPADREDPARRRSGRLTVEEGNDWCATVWVSGLEPGRSYRYWFETETGVLSPVGRTRTLPDDHATELRLGVVCCSDLTMGWFTGYRAVADEELDLVLHLGDAIYETSKGERRPGPHGRARTLADYRARHAATRADPDLQALHLRHPVVFVWDDHDVADNAWRFGAKAHDPDADGPYAERLHHAARARQEWLPCRLEDPDDLLDMHRDFTLGALAELLVLDTRIPSRDQQADAPGALPLDDPTRSLIGPDQRAWAAARLADRTRPWALVATAVTMSPLTLPIQLDEIPLLDDSLPSGYAVVDGVALCTDEWDGYPLERARLLSMFRDRGGGCVVLSGDVHSSWALELREGDEPVALELVCPSLTSKPMGLQLPRGARSFAELAADAMPHRRWSDLEANGWLRLSITRERVRADWFEVDCTEPPAGAAAGGPGEALASWEALPDLPARLREAAAPLASWPDRGGVPVEWLPPTPVTRPARSPGRRVGAALLLGAAVAIAVLVVRRRRRG